jgi:hypothetical protein
LVYHSNWIIHGRNNLVLYFYLFLVVGGLLAFFASAARHIPHDQYIGTIFKILERTPLIGPFYKMDTVNKINEMLPIWHRQKLNYYENPYLGSYHWYIIFVSFSLPYMLLFLTSYSNPGIITSGNVMKVLTRYDYDWILFHDKFCVSCLLQK